MPVASRETRKSKMMMMVMAGDFHSKIHFISHSQLFVQPIECSPHKAQSLSAGRNLLLQSICLSTEQRIEHNETTTPTTSRPDNNNGARINGFSSGSSFSLSTGLFTHCYWNLLVPCYVYGHTRDTIPTCASRGWDSNFRLMGNKYCSLCHELACAVVHWHV